MQFMKFLSRTEIRILLFDCVLIGVLPQVGLTQINSAVIGTWKLNRGKSTYDPGPPPTIQTLTYEKSGDGQKLSNETVSASGTRTIQGYTANYDGKDYPRTGSGYADTIALKRIDAYTVQETMKKGGKQVAAVNQVVSKDGKVMTFVVTGTNASGQSIHNVQLYDKQ